LPECSIQSTLGFVPRLPRSNPLALAVLTCLMERPMHPYEIAQTLRERAKDENIRLNYGSLYAVVDSLSKRGLVVATETVREGRRPERTVYAVTDPGRREAIDWLTDLLATPAKEYLQFEAGLTLAVALPPDDAVAALRLRLQRLEVLRMHEAATLQAMADMGLPRLFALEGEYMAALLDAELAFVRALVADIESGSLDGLDQWRAIHEEQPT
jgi:DNA-binding PadR family transcriptional regulator